MNHVGFKKFAFDWQGLSKEGKILSGILFAKNKQEVALLLKHQQIQSLKINKKYRFLRITLTQIQLAALCRQLGILIRSGVPLLQATQLMLTSQTHPLLHHFLELAHKEVSSGQPLSKLFSHGIYQDDFTYHFVALGESTGLLSDMLIRVAEYKEKQLYLRQQMKQACSYPLLILFTTLIVTITMLIFVIPSFESLFSSALTQLPLYTRAILWLSDILRNHFFLLLLIFSGLLILFFYALKNKSIFEHICRIILKVALFKHLSTHLFLITFSTTLGTAISSGIPLIDALKLSKRCTSRAPILSIIQAIEDDLKRGKSFFLSIQSHTLFPSIFCQMVHIGEETGTLDHMLQQLAERYSNELLETITYLKKLTEPLLMLIVGVLIGGLVIAMYIPIFKLGTVI